MSTPPPPYPGNFQQGSFSQSDQSNSAMLSSNQSNLPPLPPGQSCAPLNFPPQQHPSNVQQGSFRQSVQGNSAMLSSNQSNLPPSTTTCTSKIELRISCKNLMDRDVLSMSDPMVTAELKFQNKWCEVGRTENIENSLNPEFNKAIQLDYYFEEVQHIRFSVYDIDNSTPELNDDDFLGEAEFTVGEIVSLKSTSKNLTYKDGSKVSSGLILITAEEIDDVCKDELFLKFSAKGLDKKDFFGKSDPYLEFKRVLPDGKLLLCHRTEYINQNLNPVWREFRIPQRVLCGNNIEQEIKILCYDYDNDGRHDFIGECSTNFMHLIENSSELKSWKLINPKKLAKKGKSYKGSGTLVLNSCRVQKVYSFLDYILSGTKLNFIVAVDFTASNGEPTHPQSLHYIDPYHPNEYMQAIKAVGSVLQDYDFDKMYPALGFGAKIPPEYLVSHEFALNFNLSSPFCSGIDGLLQAYSNCIRQIKLYGPTNFTPVINHATKFALHAHQNSQPQDYFVLLILTDGIITDMSKTRDAIVKASGLPLSIIIVGVGDADFSGMNALDGDDQSLRSCNGELAVRDIVQFVPFRKYLNMGPAQLCKEVLVEIPKQLSNYYMIRNMPPMTNESS